MLKEAIKETIGEFASPDKIEEFLKYDDFKLWSLMESRSKWFLKIKNREHIRMIAETKESPIQEEIDRIEKAKEILKNYNIWHFEDTPKEPKSWYKIEDDEEIKIITKNKKVIRLLSEYSVIVKSLKKQYLKTRLYVKTEDKDNAEKLLKEVLK